MARTIDPCCHKYPLSLYDALVVYSYPSTPSDFISHCLHFPAQLTHTTRPQLRERERQLELDQDRLARDKGGVGIRKKQYHHPGIERSSHGGGGNLGDVTPPPDPYALGGAVRGHHLGNPRSRVKMNPLGNSPPLRKIDDRGPYRSHSHAAMAGEGGDFDSRPVAYNENATPLNPFGDDDDSGLGGMFSPLSMASVDTKHHRNSNSNHRDPPSSGLSKQNKGGVKPIRTRGPRFADVSNEDNDGNSVDTDDQGGGSVNNALMNKLAHARKGSPRMKKRADNYDSGHPTLTLTNLP